MMNELLSVLRSRRERKVQGIEEMAVRLAKGEDIAPEEVEAVLDRCGATPEQLVEAVEAHERRAELRATAAREGKALQELQAIERKRVPIAEQAEAAAARLTQFDADTAVTLGTLNDTVRQARTAAAGLLADRNLRPEALAALNVARQMYAEAQRAASAAREELDEGRRRHREMIEQLTHNESVGNRSIPEHVEQVKRDRTAVEARAQRVGEFEQAVAEAAQAEERAKVALRQAEDIARRS